mmetsp:Transcript_30610/g.35394  ORF Transcript_30610/g.35394 Transcript_30610/m.35394 type:complete len:353 (+) Transcript_30610:57-1115(+)
MLSRILQLFSQKRVAPSVEEEAFEQNENLQQIKREIATIEGQLNDSLRTLTRVQMREEELRSQIECLLLEIHDPLLIRADEHAAMSSSSASGDSHDAEAQELENIPFRLRDAAATLSRIREVVEINVPSESDADGSDPSTDEDSSVDHQKQVNRRKRLQWKRDVERGRQGKLPFVVLDEHSDVDDGSSSAGSDADERGELNPTVAVTIESEASKSRRPKERPKKIEQSIVHLDRLVATDFVSSSEWRRWQIHFGKMQQARLLEEHFRGKILRDVVARREELEGRIFARRCDLIHMKAFEEHAEQQLRSSGILVLNRDQMLMLGRQTSDGEVTHSSAVVGAPPVMSVIPSSAA